VDADARTLVPGDIVHLDIGDIVPADIRLLHAEDMTTDEAALTGESMPVIKKVKTMSAQHSVPQYLQNMAFMGTTVSSGYGHGIVTATGADTFFGKSASLIKEGEETNFQRSINRFGTLQLKIILMMTAFVLFANALLGKGLFDSFLFAVALAVGITPEALPMIITITLSKGASNMAKENVVIKKLSAVENLGDMDVICCDKTGTLTEGKIALHGHVNVDGKQDSLVALYGMLCNTLKSRKAFGNPMDKAIWDSPAAKALGAEFARYKVVDENEFDFERKRMSVVVKTGGGFELIAKGSAQNVIGASSTVLSRGRSLPMTKQLADKLNKEVNAYESKGLRVLAIAKKRVRQASTHKEDERALALVGFLLFSDPPKSTAREALESLERLHVSVKVLSGDSEVVTRKVCDDVGLAIAGNRIVTGEELDGMGEAELKECAEKFNVFARMTPKHKSMIVSTLKSDEHVVGFLGDGINDAPALKEADVGISVDTGAGIAKEAADVILLRKSLRVLAAGIKAGRITFNNIMKYIFNTTSANYGNMFTVAASSLFLKFIPLLPSQILLNNFFSDVPLLTVATDRVDEEALKRPKHWDMNLIYRFMWEFGLISAFYDFAFILPLLFVFNVSEGVFRTAWFLESMLSEVLVVFALRTHKTFFKSVPSAWLVGSTVLISIIAIALVYSPLGATLFQFVPLPPNVLALMAIVLVAYFATDELLKKRFFRKFDI
jgi:Mg2+-importing ATPase